MTPDHLHLVFEYDETLGFYQWEKHQKQKLIITVNIECDVRAAAKTDDLKDTIDYDQIDRLIRELFSKKHYHLIETIAEEVAQKLHEKWPHADLEIMVDKPFAITHAKKISVIVNRKGKK